jgi:hypothetical protein
MTVPMSSRPLTRRSSAAMSFGGDSSTSPSTEPGMPADIGISNGGFTPTATPSAQPWKWPVNFTSFGRPVAARASRMARCVASVPDIVNRTISAEGTSRVIQSAHSTSSSWQAP